MLCHIDIEADCFESKLLAKNGYSLIIMSLLTVGYSFSMKTSHNLFKLDMKRFVIVRMLLYVTACLTKLHIIACCIAEQMVGIRVGWAETLGNWATIYSKQGLLFFWKTYQTRPLIKQGPLFKYIQYSKNNNNNNK